MPLTADRRHWTARTLAGQLVARGFAVDVISEHNTTFVPREDYAIFLATRRAFPQYAGSLPARCVKIVLLEDRDVIDGNAAELARLVALKDRRGLVVTPLGVERPTPVLQQATCAIVEGNGATLDTYRHVRIPLHQVPAVAPAEESPPTGKTFDVVRRRFVWLGGRNVVHDGLDLVLDAFAALPDTRLTVCGDVTAERRFQAAYARELHGTPHISAAGPIAFASPRFRTLARESVGLVFPSCGAGQAAAVLAAMGAGLIPIVTRESGVDVDGCGLVLADDSVDAIRIAVRTVIDLPAQRLSDMAMAAWERARNHHAPSAVARRYDEVLTAIIGQPAASRSGPEAAGPSSAAQAPSGD
jgi:glycosyltransferase involved in cell wall biosynthesis